MDSHTGLQSIETTRIEAIQAPIFRVGIATYGSNTDQHPDNPRLIEISDFGYPQTRSKAATNTELIKCDTVFQLKQGILRYYNDISNFGRFKKNRNVTFCKLGGYL